MKKYDLSEVKHTISLYDLNQVKENLNDYELKQLAYFMKTNQYSLLELDFGSYILKEHFDLFIEVKNSDEHTNKLLS